MEHLVFASSAETLQLDVTVAAGFGGSAKSLMCENCLCTYLSLIYSKKTRKHKQQPRTSGQPCPWKPSVGLFWPDFSRWN